MWFYYRSLVAPTVQSYSLDWPFISIVSIEFLRVINMSLHRVSYEISISRSNYYTCFCACSVMFYFSCTLSFMLSTFQVLTHTCATSSRDVGSGSQHPDHAYINFSISSSEDSVVSSHSLRTTVMSFILVFSHLVSVFARFIWGLSQYF